VAYALGIVIAYVLNSVLVFRVPLSLKRFTAYPLVYLVQYVIAAGLLAIAVEVLHAPEAIAPLAVLVIMVPFSYVLNRLVLARSGGNAPQDPSP
jgi:putative flippase GtrA